MNRFIATLIAWSQAFSIRFKIMGLAVGMVFIMGLAASLLTQSAMVSSMSAELERRGASIAADIAARGADMLLTHDFLGLHELLRETIEHNEDVYYAVLLDSRNRVVSHTFQGGFPADLLGLSLPPGTGRPLVQLMDTEEGRLHDVSRTILGGMAGTVRVGMSPQRMSREAMSLAESLTVTIFVVAALALFAAYLLTIFLTRPVLDLVAVARAVAAGDLTKRAAPGPPDELGLLVASFNDMMGELQTSQQTKDELLDRVIAAQEDERKRIARELHDETGQAITSFIVGLKSLEEDHPEIRSRSEELRQLAAATLDEIHGLIMELRPRVLDEMGLIPALRRYVSDFGQKYGVATQFHAQGTGDRLPPRIETCMYRIVQEALTNVARHAGASSASVVLDIRSGVVSAIVEDDGRGFDPQASIGYRSLGIAGMRERAVLLHGTLQVESSPGSGTSVYVKIPTGR